MAAKRGNGNAGKASKSGVHTMRGNHSTTPHQGQNTGTKMAMPKNNGPKCVNK